MASVPDTQSKTRAAPLPGLTSKVAHADVSHVELPVALAGDGHPRVVARVVRPVDAPKHNLASFLGAAATAVPEGEDGLLHEALGDHILAAQG